MQVQAGYLYRVLPQLFGYEVNGHGDSVPVERAVLTAYVHHAAVGVDYFHALAHVGAFHGAVGALILVAGRAEGGARAHASVGDGMIVYGGDEAVFVKADLYMAEALVHQQVEGLLAGIHAAHGPPGAPGQQRGDLLGAAQAPVAVFSAHEQTLLHRLFGGQIIAFADGVAVSYRALYVQARLGAVIRVVEPPGYRAWRIGYDRAEGRHVQIVFYNVRRGGHGGVHVALLHVGEAHVASLRRIVRGGRTGAEARRLALLGAYHVSALLAAFEDVHHVGQDLPFYFQPSESLAAYLLALGYHDHADLGALLIGLVVQPGPGIAPKLAVALEIPYLLVFPGDDVHHAVESARLGVVYAFDLRVRVRAVEELCKKHVRLYVIAAVFGDARRHGIGQHSRQVGLAHHPEFFTKTVYTVKIRHDNTAP